MWRGRTRGRGQVFVTGNDSDPDGDSFGVVGVDTPAHGSAFFGSSGIYTRRRWGSRGWRR